MARRAANRPAARSSCGDAHTLNKRTSKGSYSWKWHSGGYGWKMGSPTGTTDSTWCVNSAMSSSSTIVGCTRFASATVTPASNSAFAKAGVRCGAAASTHEHHRTPRQTNGTASRTQRISKQRSQARVWAPATACGVAKGRGTYLRRRHCLSCRLFHAGAAHVVLDMAAGRSQAGVSSVHHDTRRPAVPRRAARPPPRGGLSIGAPDVSGPTPRAPTWCVERPTPLTLSASVPPVLPIISKPPD